MRDGGVIQTPSDVMPMDLGDAGVGDGRCAEPEKSIPKILPCTFSPPDGEFARAAFAVDGEKLAFLCLSSDRMTPDGVNMITS